MGKINFKIVYFVVVIAILIISFIPGWDVSRHHILAFRFELRLDYFAHAVIFTGLVILNMLYFNQKFGVLLMKHIALVTLLSFVLALFSEGVQFFIPGRAFNLMDIFFDMVGIILGLPISLLIVRIVLVKR